MYRARQRRNKSIAKKTIAVVVLLIVGILGIAIFNVTHKPDKTLSGDGVVRHSTDNPSEKRPNSDYKWQGAPNEPKKITISSIGVDAFVQKVGIDQNNQVGVPNNIFLVGWFVETVHPGEKGLSVIDGHVVGRVNDGIFKDLGKVSKGDRIAVQLGNDTIINYEVMGSKSAVVKESVNIIFSQNPKVARQLNLVTCSGRYNPKTRSYDERLTVMAKQV